MYSFELDDTIVPVESTWFGWINETMEETTGYQESWIGLRTLNEQGKIERRVLPGMKHVWHDSLDEALILRRTFHLTLSKLNWFNGLAHQIPRSLHLRPTHLKY